MQCRRYKILAGTNLGNCHRRGASASHQGRRQSPNRLQLSLRLKSSRQTLNSSYRSWLIQRVCISSVSSRRSNSLKIHQKAVFPMLNKFKALFPSTTPLTTRVWLNSSQMVPQRWTISVGLQEETTPRATTTTTMKILPMSARIGKSQATAERGLCIQGETQAKDSINHSKLHQISNDKTWRG